MAQAFVMTTGDRRTALDTAFQLALQELHRGGRPLVLQRGLLTVRPRLALAFSERYPCGSMSLHPPGFIGPCLPTGSRTAPTARKGPTIGEMPRIPLPLVNHSRAPSVRLNERAHAHGRFDVGMAHIRKGC
jgi:hypothetical protein